MEIWLLLTVASMVSSTTTVIVNEAANKQVIPEGSSVALQCCLWIEDPERYRVFWYFNPNETSKTGLKNLSNILNNTTTTKDNRKILATHNLHNVSQNESGWYYCHVKVEIPYLESKDSNWTELVVNKRLIMENTENTSQIVVTEQAPEKPPFDWRDWWMWITVGASCIVSVILLTVSFVLRRRRLRLRALESPIYANMHPVNSSRQPSPRPRPTDTNTNTNTNTLKLDSKAYQNLQTPNMGKRYEHGRRQCR